MTRVHVQPVLPAGTSTVPAAGGLRAAALLAAGPLVLVLTGLARLDWPLAPGLVLTVTAGVVPIALAVVLRRLAGPRAAVVVSTAAWTLTCLGALTAERLVPGRGVTQATWGLLGVVLFATVATFAGRGLPVAGRKATGRAAALVGCALLSLPFVPGVGIAGLGARNWVAIGPLAGQPGEVARPLLIVAAALVLVSAGPALRSGRVRPLVSGAWPLGVAVALLVLANDLGPVLVLGAAVLAMVLITGMRRRQAGALLAMVALGVVGAFLLVGKLRERLDQMLEPVLGDGRLQNTGAALQALARGGWTGEGFGRGNPGAVANVDDDFVLAAVGEERGIVGLLAVAILLAALTVAALRSALRARGAASRLLAVGLSTALAVQGIYVFLATLTVVPVTGMVVPFLSRGGSALLGLWLALGVVVGVGARSSPSARAPGDAAMDGRARRVLAALQGAWALVCVLVVAVGVAPPVAAASGAAVPPVSERGELLARDGTVLARTDVAEGGPARSYPAADLVGPVAADLDLEVAARLGCDPTWWQSLVDLGCSPDHVVSTVSPVVQRAMHEALAGVVGDAVALDAESGDVLGVWSSDVGAGVTRGAGGPPALHLASAPGSTFKTVVAAAVLSRGLAGTTPRRDRYTPPGGHGEVRNAGGRTLGGSLEEALAASANTSFAELAVHVGGNAIAGMASEMSSWPESVGSAHGPSISVGEELADVDALARTGFGQQDVRATPLNMAVVAATIAAGGRRPTPRLVAGTCSTGGFEPESVVEGPAVLDRAVAQQITEGMRLAVEQGAAPALTELDVPVAAKTGTADDGTGAYDGWVVAAAPAGGTQVVVAVRIMADPEAGVSRTGAGDAAPVAAQVLLAAGGAVSQDERPCDRDREED